MASPWLLVALLASALYAQPPAIRITAQPPRPYIEIGTSQELNFDFVLENQTDEQWRLESIAVEIYDRNGKLASSQAVDGRGFSPSILTVAQREAKAGESMVVFNPFYSFAPYLDLHELRYRFTLASAAPRETSLELRVVPMRYQTKTDLVLPLRGRVFVKAGHDFYAHHRRLDYLHPFARQLGFHANFMRYGYDFYVVDQAGRTFRKDGETAEDWYGYGAPVHAPGAGRVVALADHYAEDLGGKLLTAESLAKDAGLFYGNYVTLDHGNGEYSLLAHLKQGAIRVKVGDTVKQGQVIGAVGLSGSAEEPHVHYELRSAPGFDAEGIPSYFRDFVRHLGSRDVPVKKAKLDTGDIISGEQAAK
jgi:murein DD-endopeptidase MepM/ murein hydrolase activator NlpD